jgi:Tfp pilus assembly protein PilN
MNVGFNLASHPYENLRPRYTLAWLGVVLALVLALVLAGRERQQRAENRSLTQQMARFEQQMQDLARERTELEAWLRRPEVQEIRDHSAFLNSLITRKSLSWTRMFLDLEEILPERAQVVSIQPRINRAQQPELALTVAADETTPLVELLRNLESSPQFGSPTVESQRFTTDRNQQTRVALDLSTQYRQVLPEAENPESGLPESAVSPEAPASPVSTESAPGDSPASGAAASSGVADAAAARRRGGY